jgi:hypothetical protein
LALQQHIPVFIVFLDSFELEGITPGGCGGGGGDGRFDINALTLQLLT